MTSEYKFTDPENNPCFVCDHVLSKERPILHVAHDKDEDDDYCGFWKFLCGQEHGEINGRVISMKEATNLDNSINDLHEMPFDSIADRKSINDKWIIKISK